MDYRLQEKRMKGSKQMLVAGENYMQFLAKRINYKVRDCTKRPLMKKFFAGLKMIRLMKYIKNVKVQDVAVNRKMAFLASKERLYNCSDCFAKFINRRRNHHTCADKTVFDYDWPKSGNQFFCLLCFKLCSWRMHLSCHYLRRHHPDDLKELGIAPKILHKYIMEKIAPRLDLPNKPWPHLWSDSSSASDSIDSDLSVPSNAIIFHASPTKKTRQ